MFGKLKDMGNLVKQAKEMKAEMEKVQASLKDEKIKVENKKGTIKIAMTAELVCIGLLIDPELIEEASKSDDKKKEFEKELMSTFNNAAEKAKKVASDKLAKISQGMNIPGLT